MPPLIFIFINMKQKKKKNFEFSNKMVKIITMVSSQKNTCVNICNTVYYIVSLVLRQTMLSVHNILSAFEFFRELAERLLTTRDGVID